MATDSPPRGAYESSAERGRITGERPRCQDGDRRKRSELVGVRFTPAELDDARRLAAQHDLSVPELLRIGLTLLTASEVSRA